MKTSKRGCIISLLVLAKSWNVVYLILDAALYVWIKDSGSGCKQQKTLQQRA
jgi:hypothetical protein